MTVYATPSASGRLIHTAENNAGIVAATASLDLSLYARNRMCPIRGPLLPEAEGNTKEYQWKEWNRQTGTEWTNGVDDYNNDTRGINELEMVEVPEPSEAWQKKMGVDLVPMSEVYGARSRARRYESGNSIAEPSRSVVPSTSLRSMCQALLSGSSSA
jgi:hypothetical protein